MKHNYFYKQVLLWTTLIFFGIYSYGQVPNYYNGTDITQTGDNLKTDLAVLIINTHTTNLIYTPGVWDALKQTDLDPTNANNVFLIYGYDDTDADITNDRTRGKDMNGGNVGDWNREHTYPRSLGSPNLGSTGPGSDAHHLRPSDVQYNSLRNNHRFTDGSGNSGLIGGNTWYPGDEWKGDIARMMMYMYLRYGNQCLPSAVGTGTQNFHPDMMDIFLEWNAEDPVSQVEINRNVLLEGIQGNRNPFIDNPIFATSIWGGPQAEDRFNSGTTDTEAPTIPTNLVASNTTQTETVLNWDASTDNVGVLAYQIFNGTTQIASATATTYTVTGLTPNTQYTFTVRAIDAASNTSADSNPATITTLEDTTPPAGSDLIITGVFDGPLSGGIPKFVEFYVVNDIPDLSAYGFGSANNGGGTDGEEFTFSGGSAVAGDFIYVASETTGFTSFFGFAPNATSSAAAINGDDAIELFSGGVVIDIFGDIAVDGSGQPWDYLDGWAYRNDDTGADGNTFVLANWTFSGINAMDGQTDNATATTPFPTGTYQRQAVVAEIIINEVDADQTSTDAAEFVELFDGGVGNTSLDGLVLVLYNGSNDLSYNAIDLDGQSTNAEGYFVIGSANVANVDLVTFTTNGIQNGADAVALYTGDATDFPSSTPVTTNNLLDALVYDTNDGDDAELLVLLNNGEAQINEGGAGNKDEHSMQRIPNGAGGLRNTTSYSQATPTPGAENTTGVVADTEDPTAPTNLVASGTTQTGTVLTWDAATDNVAVTEYQIFNGTTQIGTTTDLTFNVTGLTASTNYSFAVVALDAAGNTSVESNSVSITTLDDTQTGSALIITGVFDGPLTGGVPKTIELYVTEDISDLSIYGLGAANNGGGTDGEEFTFPADAATAGSFIYIASEAPGFTTFFGFAPNYTSSQAAGINGDDAVELFMNGTVVDVFGDINVDGSGQPWDYQDGWAYRNDDTGADGNTFILGNWTFSGANALDGETTNATAVTPFPIGTYQKQGPAVIVINEVDADNPGTDSLEFVELFDGGAGNTPLDGLVLVLYNGNNDSSYNAIDLDGQSTNAEGYFVIGSATVANVNLAAFTTNGLQNGADAVALYIGDATDFPSSTAVTTNNLLDALVYDTNDGDDAGLLVLLNTGEAQINEGALGNKDGHSSQRIPNGGGGLRNTATYTQRTPTPGTENGAIIPPPDPISILEARNTAENELVTVRGVLTVSDQFSGSAYIQDSTGGIAIFDELVHGDGNFMIGDSISVSGTRSMFNEQIQISNLISVENNGTPNQQIVPLTITLSELMNHPAELVQIVNPSFPVPGDILFGNSNYTLTDSSGSGQLRIDNDVEAIVGLGQPETCSEVTGVVGRFFTTYQLLPRMAADMSCAGPYIPPTPPINVPKDKTFDIVTWNIKWFGDEQNSPPAGNPMSDAIQKDSVKTVIMQLDADIYTVEEISDDVLFAQMVSELPGYAYVLSPAVSRPNDPGVKQKLGFIYNTATVNVLETKVLLESIHPLYNGGDDSALVGYPSTTDRFYATGRLPFLMKADITIDGQTEQFDIVALHARANSGSSSQNRYDMRKYDVEVLKDSLDAHYSNTNLILIGDYNDDVDVTVADVTTTVSTYESYIADTTNYNMISKALSEAGLRSFVFRENMIDHITISEELNFNYIDQSIRVHYEFYDNDYPFTASDHFPVSARFQLKEFELTGASSTDITCNGEADGTATVSVSGGISPYTYNWSDGQTTATVSGLTAGTYNVIVTDALENGIVQEFIIEETSAITLTTSGNTTVYKGYEPQACTILELTEVEGGTAPYTIEWSSGDTTDTVEVCPEETTTYTVTVTDANGCTVSADITVEVIDVQCGHNPNRPKVHICHNGRTICISEHAVQRHLDHGDVLGSCGDTAEVSITRLRVYPNPFRRHLNIKLNSNVDTNVRIAIFNIHGRKVFQRRTQLNEGENVLRYNLSRLRSHRVYFLKIFANGQLQKVRLILKH